MEELRQELVQRLVSENFALGLSRAMRIDPERVHWKLWWRSDRAPQLTVHFTPVVPKEIAGVTFDENLRFWDQVRKVLGPLKDRIAVGYDDRIALEVWETFPCYEHTVLAKGGPYGGAAWDHEVPSASSSMASRR